MGFMKPKEGDLVKQVIAYLNLRRVFAWRQNQGAVASTHKGKRSFVRFAGVEGISDIIGILPGGRFLAIETKVRPNKPTKVQRAFLDAVTLAGGLAIVAYDLDDVIQVIP
jgi:hypothetical protein